MYKSPRESPIRALIPFILLCDAMSTPRAGLDCLEPFNYIYFITRDRAVRVIFSIVDKLECPYDLRMFALSSYDRRKFYPARALPVFKSHLLRPAISISSHGRRVPIKETKWISTRDAAGGVIRGGTPDCFNTRRKEDAETQRGKRRRKCYCRRWIRASWCSMRDAHLSRGR